jgi:hypothetical protein
MKKIRRLNREEREMKRSRGFMNENTLPNIEFTADKNNVKLSTLLTAITAQSQKPLELCLIQRELVCSETAVTYARLIMNTAFSFLKTLQNEVQ